MPKPVGRVNSTLVSVPVDRQVCPTWLPTEPLKARASLVRRLRDEPISLRRVDGGFLPSCGRPATPSSNGFSPALLM